MFDDNDDLSGITEQRPFEVSQVAHRAIIEVDEDGTTAAAATIFKADWKSLTGKVPIVFRADHPFLFILTERKDPLFIGQFV
ncbi:Serpin (Serine protease inhibitor) [Trichostrongylus colubriformis]|uniref:Serpin (Serine protease inhibitor) n=1 Tax=Trichostrongylus colubriformis TaxID=6319 RepID=A0AAN8FIH4_TRICO